MPAPLPATSIIHYKFVEFEPSAFLLCTRNNNKNNASYLFYHICGINRHTRWKKAKSGTESTLSIATVERFERDSTMCTSKQREKNSELKILNRLLLNVWPFILSAHELECVCDSLATLPLAAVAISYSKSQPYEYDFIDLSVVCVCGSSSLVHCDILTLIQIVIRTESTSGKSKNSHFDHIE